MKLMNSKLIIRHSVLIAIGFLLSVTTAHAAEIKLRSSAGFKAAYLELSAEFERMTGHKLVNAWGPSMGDTPQAVPNRIARGEPVDVVIIVGEAFDDLVKNGKVAAGSRADLANSVIAGAVRTGTRKPDLSSV